MYNKSIYWYNQIYNVIDYQYYVKEFRNIPYCNLIIFVSSIIFPAERRYIYHIIYVGQKKNVTCFYNNLYSTQSVQFLVSSQHGIFFLLERLCIFLYFTVYFLHFENDINNINNDRGN